MFRAGLLAAALLPALLAGCCRPCPPPTRTTEEVVAARWIARARAAEPATTQLLLDVARETGGELVGLEHRIKTPASILSKIERVREKTPDTAPEDAVVYDALRYTLVVPDEPPGHHDRAVRHALEVLEATGHVVEKVKNYWPRGDSYSGTNCVLVSRDGLPWELQIHTPASYATKTRTHEDYERMREDETPVAERRRLFEAMKILWDAVPIPVGILVSGSLHAEEQLVLLPAP